MMIEPQFPIEGVTYHGVEDAARYLQGGAWYGVTAGDALRKTASRLPDKLSHSAKRNELAIGQASGG